MLIYQHHLPRSVYIINYHRAKNARIPFFCKLIVIYLCSKQISKSKTICDSVLNASKFFYFRKEEKKIIQILFPQQKTKKTLPRKKIPQHNRYTKCVLRVNYVQDQTGCIPFPLSKMELELYLKSALKLWNKISRRSYMQIHV